MGRRVRKTVSSGYSGGSYTTTNVTTYVWDGFNIIAEMCDEGYTNWYTYGLDLSGTLQGAGGVGGALAMSRDTGTATNTYLYCFDGNGNVVNLVDAGDGSIAATYEYSPFGSLIRSTGDMADDNPVRWSTKHTDDETGLVMYEFRVYSPELGRWLSKDPLGDEVFLLEVSKGTTARERKRLRSRGLAPSYLFVENAPAFKLDPIGLDVVNNCSEWVWIRLNNAWQSLSPTLLPGGAVGTLSGDTDGVSWGNWGDHANQMYKWVDCYDATLTCPEEVDPITGLGTGDYKCTVSLTYVGTKHCAGQPTAKKKAICYCMCKTAISAAIGQAAKGGWFPNASGPWPDPGPTPGPTIP